MRKPAGVIAAAVVLGLMAAIGLLGVVLESIVTFLIHNPVMPAGALGHQVRIVVAVVNLIFFCVFAFCAWTVLGLFRMRAWARHSIIVLGVLIALFSAAMSVLILFAAKFVPASIASSGGPAGLHLGIFFVFASLFYASIALIGLWWVVYFNLKHVREAFGRARTQAPGALVDGAALPVQSEYGSWRIVVIVLAVFMLLGGVDLLGMGVLHLPLYFFGFILTGKSALSVALLMAAIAVFIGIGLLRRNQAAYWAAIGWQVYGILMMAFLLLPSARLRLVAYQAEINQRFALPGIPTPSFAMTGPFLVAISVFCWAIFLVFLYALLRCRRWYAPEPGY